MCIQEALDPEYGQREVAEMKKEVHRMELRLGQLERKKEEIVKDAVRAIEKRELIYNRYACRPSMSRGDRRGAPVT